MRGNKHWAETRYARYCIVGSVPSVTVQTRQFTLAAKPISTGIQQAIVRRCPQLGLIASLDSIHNSENALHHFFRERELNVQIFRNISMALVPWPSINIH